MNLARFTASWLAATLLVAAGTFGGNEVAAAPRASLSVPAPLVTSGGAGSARPSHSARQAVGAASDSVVPSAPAVGLDGTVSLRTALEAFSAVFGPLPGVRALTGPPEAVMDATFAVNWVLGYWGQLSAAQRTAIREYLSGPLATNGALATQGDEAPGGRLAALTDPPAAPYLAMVENDEKDIAAHIGHPVGLPVSVVVNSVQFKTYFAYTTPYDSHGGFTGAPVRCVIYINPRLYQALDVSVANDGLMHEVFHCFQAADYPTVAAYAKAPDWLIEGSAAWVGQTLSPSPTVANGWWSHYLLDISQSLFGRMYDAIGFFAHMDETGTNPWHSFDVMFKSHTSAQAYAVATDRQFKLTWASSFLRRPSFGDGWDATGPAIPDAGDMAFVPTVHVLAANQSLTGKVPAYTNAVVGITTSANALQVNVSTPYSRLHDSTNHDFDDLQAAPNRFCLNNCSASAVLASLPRLTPGEVWLAVTGDTAGATYSILALNDVPCLVGHWVTTNWTLIAAEGSVSGGAGVHYTVTSSQADIDFTGMAPLGGLRFGGQGFEDLDYSQSTTAISGTLSVIELPASDITLSVDGGPPIAATYDKDPVHSGNGTWSCSGDTMSWDLTNSTGRELLDFTRSPA
jgi:hypothetical protein